MESAIFFKEKPLRTLVTLAKKDRIWYPSMLCKEIDCTYPHMMSVLEVFENQKLIESEEQGRIRIVRLTEKGEDLAKDFETVLRRMDKMK